MAISIWKVFRMIEQHYDELEPGQLLEKVRRSLQPDSPLPALDQFHAGGLQATRKLAELAQIQPGIKILDAGSGLGGPSRYLAQTYQAKVTGIDLTPAYIEISRLLADHTHTPVDYRQGNLLQLPFPDAEFDLVWTQHVVMNIHDRDALYRELRRVLRPAGKLAFFDVLAADGHPPLEFPVPWASTPAASHLLTLEETRQSLHQAGLLLDTEQDVTSEILELLKTQLPPSGLSLATVLGNRTPQLVANFAKNLSLGRARLVMGIATA